MHEDAPRRLRAGEGLDMRVVSTEMARRVIVSGDVDRGGRAETVREALIDLVLDEADRIEIDLHGVRFMDLAGARAVGAARREATKRGVDLVIVAHSFASASLFEALDVIDAAAGP
jgi:anti-anti-sigma factor